METSFKNSESKFEALFNLILYTYLLIRVCTCNEVNDIILCFAGQTCLK